MSIEGPGSRAVLMTNAAVASGGYWLAMVLLAAGAACGALIYGDRLDQAAPLLIGYGLVAVAGTALHVFTSARRGAVVFAAVVGAVGIWSAATAVGVLVPTGRLGSSIYFFSDLTVAVVFLGTLLWRTGHAAIAVTVSFATTQMIVAAAVITAGGVAQLDLPAFAVWAVVTTVLVGLQLQRRRARVTEPQFQQATTRTRMSAELRNASMQRVATLHDTVLSDLAALALMSPGQLPARTTARLADTLDVLRKGLERPTPGPSGTSRAALAEILDRRPTGGVPLQVSGDASALTRMDPEARDALLLALTQCLSNIDRHSQATTAELFIGSSGTDVTVMVSDDGVGFDPDAVASDRLGLKSSIRSRLEAVDGRGEVWSAPGGGGTTVVLTAPLRDQSRERQRRS